MLQGRYGSNWIDVWIDVLKGLELTVFDENYECRLF